MDSTDDELAADVEELVDALEQVREELRPRRGPFGLPAPPSPGELLRFTDRQVIPFAIAVLEANVRALELLQGAIRLVDSGRAAGEEARRTRERAASLSRRSLERLDGVLADLEASASDRSFERRGPGQEILSEARRLRQEVEDALAERADEESSDEPPEVRGWDDQTDDGPTGDGPTDGGPIDDEPTDDEPIEDARPDVDVEGELRTIKEELGKLDEAGEDGRTENEVHPDGNGSDADGGSESGEVEQEGPDDGGERRSDESDGPEEKTDGPEEETG